MGQYGNYWGKWQKFHGRGHSQPAVSKLPLNNPKELESLGNPIICTISQGKPFSTWNRKSSDFYGDTRTWIQQLIRNRSTIIASLTQGHRMALKGG